MKKLIAALVVGFLSGFAAFPQTMKLEELGEQSIKAIERELSTALLKGDAATVDRILANDYVEVTPQGALLNKADVMAVVHARASTPRAVVAGPEVSVEKTKFTVYEKVAVYVGVMTTRYQHMQYQVTLPGQLPAPETTHRERFMKIYAKQDGTWQLVASQSTSIVSP